MRVFQNNVQNAMDAIIHVLAMAQRKALSNQGII